MRSSPSLRGVRQQEPLPAIFAARGRRCGRSSDSACRLLRALNLTMGTRRRQLPTWLATGGCEAMTVDSRFLTL